MIKGSKMSEPQRKKISETRKKLFAKHKLVTWNKGLTKKDPRVRKNISGGSRRTQFKTGPRPETKREGNANWKGGRIIVTRSGKYKHLKYVMIRVPEHPYAVNNYVFEHRLIVEKHIGRHLLPEEIVHHKNDDTLDNRYENLEVMSQGEHINLTLNRRKNNG